jgi:hypothetical protein
MILSGCSIFPFFYQDLQDLITLTLLLFFLTYLEDAGVKVVIEELVPEKVIDKKTGKVINGIERFGSKLRCMKFFKDCFL